MAKSSALKIRELFLRKLQVKIKGMELIITPGLYSEMLLDDIILLAENQGNLEKSIEVRVAEGKSADVMRLTLNEALNDYKIEIGAYMHYLKLLQDKHLLKRDIEAIMLKMINNEPHHLRARLQEILRESLSGIVSEEEAIKTGYSKEDLLFLLAYQVENLAKYHSFEDCAKVELADANYPEEQYERIYLLTTEKYRRFAPSVKKQTLAYRKALEMEYEGTEISKILTAFAKRLGAQ